MKLRAGLLASIVITGCITCVAASQAEESRLKVCMASFQKEVGVSPDIAYAECSKRSFADCIKETSGKKFVAQYVGRKTNLLSMLGMISQGGWKDGDGEQ